MIGLSLGMDRCAARRVARSKSERRRGQKHGAPRREGCQYDRFLDGQTEPEMDRYSVPVVADRYDMMTFDPAILEPKDGRA